MIGSLFSSRRYLLKIYMWITVIILLLILVFAVVMYFNIEKKILLERNENNRQILEQVNYNIDTINKLVGNICNDLYWNNVDARFLMYNKSPDITDAVISMIDLQKLVAVNPFLSSIYIYNNNSKEYYSTDKGIFQKDLSLDKLMEAYDKVPVLCLMPRKVNSKEGQMNQNYVFSYFMYETTDKSGDMNGAVILNIKSEWLFDNLKIISNIKKRESIYIVNDLGEFIGAGQRNDKLSDGILDLYNKNILKNTGTNYDSIEQEINGTRYFISYFKVKNANWYLLITRPYDDVYKNIVSIRISIIVITFIFLLLAVAASLSVSKKIYNPVSRLFRQVRPEFDTSPALYRKDEIGILSDIYEQWSSKIKEYENEKKSSVNLVKSSFLNKILLHSSTVSYEDFVKVKESYGLSLQYDESFVVCVVRIDNYKKFVSSFSMNERELYRFAISNILGEVVGRSFNNEIVALENDMIAMIINQGRHGDAFYNIISGLIREAQQFLLDKFHISFSVALSTPDPQISEVSRLYAEALRNISYRYIYGKLSLILPLMIEKNTGNSYFSISYDMEKKFSEEIKSGNITALDGIILQILKEISTLDYRYITFSVIHLVNTMMNTIEEVNKSRMEPMDIDLTFFSQSVLDYETVDELYNSLMVILKKAASGERSDAGAKQQKIVHGIIDIINSRYSNKELCLQMIAMQMKMSPSYIARVFRENMHITVAEYINEVRIKKAVEWMEKTSLNINDIIEKVGLDNLSYFYKLFKKKYGVTPKQYQVEKSMKIL